MKRYRVALFGYGQMGPRHAQFIAGHPRYELAWICDLSPDRMRAARAAHPGARVTGNMEEVFADRTVDMAGIFTKSDVRPMLIRRALASGWHISAEKPLAGTEEEEWRLLEEIERAGRVFTVNLFNRNAWYHNDAKDFVRRGEIGKLAVVRVCHMFPGGIPVPGRVNPDGPPFRECGMHYADIVRYHGGSEYAEWTARGVRMWGEDPNAPHWVTVHGRLKNDVTFEITNSFAYACASKLRRNCSYTDLLGTHGVIHVQFDAWGSVNYQAFGIHETVEVTKPYQDKNYPVLYGRMADAMDTGNHGDLATARDSVIAASVAGRMNRSAVEAGPAVIGTPEDLEDVRRLRAARDASYGR